MSVSSSYNVGAALVSARPNRSRLVLHDFALPKPCREVFGNSSGLSPSALKTLERIYRRKVPLSQIASPELVRSLVDASKDTGRQVGALVHRSGQVDYVVVGDSNRLMLPDIGRLRAAEGRFRGLRLIHTHLHGEPLTKDDLVDLVRLRLDLVGALMLGVDGEPRGMQYAINVPSRNDGKPYRVVGPAPIGRDEVDFGELIAGLEVEFAKTARTREVKGKDGRAILIHVAEKGHKNAQDKAEEGLRELGELSWTAGVEVVDTILQLRERIDPRLVVGKGKLDDILIRAAELDAETLIFDRDLSPSQSSAIAKETDLKVIDRTQLILDIFAQRAGEPRRQAASGARAAQIFAPEAGAEGRFALAADRRNWWARPG